MLANRTKTRWAIRIVLLLSIPLGGAAIYEPKPTCELAATWAKDHSKSLPLSNEEISRFPVAYQRAITREMTPAQRQKVLIGHLNSFVLPADSLSPLQAQAAAGLRRPLSEDQKQFIRELIRATPELEGEPKEAGKVAIVAVRFKLRAEKLFMITEYNLIFKRIGPVLTADKNFIPISKLTQASMLPGEALLLKVAEKMHGKRFGNCMCDSGGCDVDSFCGQTYPACQETSGCCWWWPCTCNGICQAI